MKTKQNRWYEVELRDVNGQLIEKVKFFAIEKDQKAGIMGQGMVKESFVVSNFSRVMS